MSLWRSPTSQQPGVDANKLVTKNGDPATAVDQRLYLNGLHRTVGLPQQVTLWGTPADYSRGGGRSRSGKRIGELLLPGQAKMWATPRAEERCQQNSRDDYVALSRQAPLWPTPNVPNGGRTVPEQQMQAGHESQPGRKVQKPLARTAELWPTPRSHGGDRRRGRRSWAGRTRTRAICKPATRLARHRPISRNRQTQRLRPLNEVVCRSSRLDLGCETHGGKSSKSTRRLNPRFVAWLMGWPLTDFGFSEMGSCPSQAAYAFVSLWSALRACK